MKEKTKNIQQGLKPGRKISLFLWLRLLGVALFVYILTTVDLKALWNYLRDVDTGFLIYGIIFQLILLFLKASRWHILNNGSVGRMAILQSFGEFFESYAIGVITPGRAGELVKAGHAGEKNKIMETGIRVVIERGFDLGIFVSIAGLAFLFTLPNESALIIGLLALIAGAMILLLAIVFMNSASATALVQRLLNRLPFISLNLNLSFRKTSSRLQSAVILLSLASNLSYFVSCYFLALGLSFTSSFLFISGAVAVAGLLNMLPVTVMGLGTREATFLLLFKPLADPLILAFSGLVFLVAQIGGGIISLILGQIFLISAAKIQPRK